MMIQVFRDMLVLLATTTLLWLFHLYSRVLPGWVLLCVWAILFVAIASVLVWRRRVRRRAFLAVYIAADSPLQRVLRGGVIMTLSQAVLAALLALTLLLAAVRVKSATVWIVLIIAAPLFALLRAVIYTRFSAHVSAAYQSEFSLRTTLLLLGPLLLIVLLGLALQQNYPDFNAASLEQALWHVVEQEQALSSQLLLLLQVAAAGDGLRLWLAQQLLPALQLPVFLWLGWILVFVQETLFVWSLLLLQQGVLLGVNRELRR